MVTARVPLDRAGAVPRPVRVPPVLVIGAVALAVRVAYVLVVLPHYEPVSDALHYHMIATAIAEGRGFVHPFPFGFDHPTAWRPPLFPLVLGGVYAVAGPRLGAAQALNIGLGALVVVLVALLAWRIAGRPAGVGAGMLAAVFPPLVANDAPPLSDTLGLVLLLAVLLLVLDRRVAPAGAAAGLLVLTRPAAQVFAVALAFWLLWRLGWRRALGFVVAAVLVTVPWLLHNRERLGSPVLVTSNGFNLAAIYSPEALKDERFVDPVFDPRFERIRSGISEEVVLDAALRRYGMQSLRGRPLAVLEVAARNVLPLFELSPASNDRPEQLDGRSVRVRRLTLPLVWMVLAAGVVALWSLRSRRTAEPLLVAALVFPLVSLVTVSVPRLRTPFDVVSCVAIGVLWAEVAANRRHLRRRPAVEPSSGVDG